MSGTLRYLDGVQEQDMPLKKRQKVKRACRFCRRSHMTCSDLRPCERCVKRGISHLCAEDDDDDATRSPPLPNTELPSPPLASTSAPTPKARTPMLSAPPVAQAHSNGSSNGAHQTLVQAQQAHAGPSSSFKAETVSPAGSGGGGGTGLNTLLSGHGAGGTGGGLDGGGSMPETYDFASLFGPDLGVGTSSSGIGLLGASDLGQSPENPSAAFWAEWASMTSKPYISEDPDVLQSLFNLVANNNEGEEDQESPLLEPATLRSAMLSLEPLKDDAEADKDMMVQPNNFTFGYSRLLRWSSERPEHIRQAIQLATAQFRPVLHERLADYTDSELVSSERAFRAYIKDQGKAIAGLPIASAIWRRTGELYYANKRMTTLTSTSPQVWQSAKLCLYDIIDSTSFVNYWQLYSSRVLQQMQQGVDWELSFSAGLKRADSTIPVQCQVECSIVMDERKLPLAVLGIFVPIAGGGAAGNT